MCDSISNISTFGITFANNQPNQEKRFYIGLILKLIKVQVTHLIGYKFD